MVVATQLQKRLVAIATAFTLLCVGLLAQRHAAEAAHATEHSGRVVHAQELADHHEISNTAHVHGRDAHEHAGDCHLLAMAHERLVHAAPFVVAAPLEAIVSIDDVPHDAGPIAIATYRLAPKTSPPSA